MSMATGESHYISNSEIMIWMQEKSASLYGELGAEMDTANDRTQVAKDLKDLKAELHSFKAMPNKQASDYAALDEKLRRFLDDHKGSPEYDELQQKLQPMIDKLDGVQKAAEKEAHTKFIKDPLGHATENYESSKPGNEEIDSWCEKLDSQISALGEQDQRSLIVIGDLNSRLNQTHQLASNLISSANQSNLSIVQNIKG